VKLDKKSTLPLPVNTYGSSFAVKSVAADGLIDMMKSIKNQTLVLSWRIVDGKFLGVFSFLWLLLSIIYKIFDWVFVRPSRWLYRQLAA